MPTPTLPTDLVGLAHTPRELAALVEPGQVIPTYRNLYLRIADGEFLELVENVRGRWYFRRPKLHALAQTLGLQLREPSRPRSGSRRSAA